MIGIMLTPDTTLSLKVEDADGSVLGSVGPDLYDISFPVVVPLDQGVHYVIRFTRWSLNVTRENSWTMDLRVDSGHVYLGDESSDEWEWLDPLEERNVRPVTVRVMK